MNKEDLGYLKSGDLLKYGGSLGKRFPDAIFKVIDVKLGFVRNDILVELITESDVPYYYGNPPNIGKTFYVSHSQVKKIDDKNCAKYDAAKNKFLKDHRDFMIEKALYLKTEGFSNTEIASILNITEHTVKNYISK